jgi:hypothetical protein
MVRFRKEATLLNLYIQHGRRHPKEALKDWGENGPILPNCIGIHAIYGATYAYFASPYDAEKASLLTGWPFYDGDALEMKFSESLLIAKFRDGETGYFGDWGVEPMKYFEDPPLNKRSIEANRSEQSKQNAI